MSGGEFNYFQYNIEDCANDVRQKFFDYDKTCTKQTIDRITECAATLDRAARMLHRVDYFISCDDSEESFNRRWDSTLI